MILSPVSLVAGGLLSSSVLPRQDDASSKGTLWIEPDGQKPDFSETFVAGQTVDVTWNGGHNDSMSDLWVTVFDFESSDSFSQLLTSKLSPLLSLSGMS